MPPPSYSLSSATEYPSCRSKKKRVSAQLSRLMGSRSRVISFEGSRRGFSEDGICSHRNSNMSKAAAWMWHTRGIGAAAVLPTTQRRMLNASNINARSCSAKQEAITREINTRKLQPSRFKAEANMLGSVAPADHQLHTCTSARHESQAYGAAPDTLEGHSTFLYDALELSSLQELLRREIDKKSAQQQPVSHDIIPTTSAPSRQIKPLSAIHKLFKRLYTILHNSTRNSAIDTGPRKVGTVQHVIHHHHYHHNYRSIDVPAPESQPAPMSHLHGVVSRRRRAHSESCSEARRLNNVINELDLVDESVLYADAHHRPQRFSAPVLHIHSAAEYDDDNDLVSGGPKLASDENYYRRHSERF